MNTNTTAKDVVILIRLLIFTLASIGSVSFASEASPQTTSTECELVGLLTTVSRFQCEHSVNSVYYGSGHLAGSRGNSWYYDNGHLMGSVGNSWYHANGTLAGSNGNSWYDDQGHLLGTYDGLTLTDILEMMPENSN